MPAELALLAIVAAFAAGMFVGAFATAVRVARYFKARDKVIVSVEDWRRMQRAASRAPRERRNIRVASC